MFNQPKGPKKYPAPEAGAGLLSLKTPSRAAVIGAGLLMVMPRGLSQTTAAAEDPAAQRPAQTAGLDPGAHSPIFPEQPVAVQDVHKDPASQRLVRFTLRTPEGWLRRFLRQNEGDQWQVICTEGQNETQRSWRGRIVLSHNNELSYLPETPAERVPRGYWHVCRPDGSRYLQRRTPDGGCFIRNMAGRLLRFERPDGLTAEYAEGDKLERVALGGRQRRFDYAQGLLTSVTADTAQGVVVYRVPLEIARACTISWNGQVTCQSGGGGQVLLPALLPVRPDQELPIAVIRVPRCANAPVEPQAGPRFNLIAAHSPRGIGGGSEPATRGHETVHHLNSDIHTNFGQRPEFYNAVRSGEFTFNLSEGVWLGDGVGTMIKAPAGISLQDVYAAVPPCLRGRNTFYFDSSKIEGGMQLYQATYVCDEGSAFIESAHIALQLPQLYAARRAFGFEIQNAGEFVGYFLALGERIGAHKEAYRTEQDRRQALGVIQRLVEKAALVFNVGTSPQYAGIYGGERRDYLVLLRDDPRTKDLRNFAIRAYGAQWWDGVVGPAQRLGVEIGDAPALKPAPR